MSSLDKPYFTRDHVQNKHEKWREYLAGFSGKPNVRMLEIGSFEGRSAIWFAEHIVTGPGSRLTCVDPWHPLVKIRFRHNVKAAGVSDRVHGLDKPSEEALTEELAEERFDIIYIDGNHAAPHVLFDAYFAWPLLVEGGIMFFDDYGWRPDLPLGRRPKPSIDRFLSEYEDKMEVIHIGHQVFVRKKS